MIRIIPWAALLLIAFVCACMGSYLRDDATAANVAGASIEASQTVAAAMYQAEQMAALQEGIDHGWPKADVEKNIATIRSGWAPVWTAFAAVRAAHDALRAAVNAGAAQGTIAQALAQLGDAQARLAPLLAARGIK